MKGLVPALGLTLVLASPALAFDRGDVAVHGFGGWSYSETDGNRYGFATRDGSYDNGEFALNVSASPSENFDVVAQVRYEARSGEDDVELDYAFAGWRFSDDLQIRIGRVKHPFGLFGEVFDVGTLRLFQELPDSVYGPNGFTARAYNGVGVTGFALEETGWSLQYDVYAGQIEGDFVVPGALVSPQLRPEPRLDIGFEVDDTVGFRLDFATPVEGLHFGLSAYRGEETVTEMVTDRTVWLLHGEYVGSRWTLRAETGFFESEERYEQESTYLEVGWKLSDHWQLAARAELYDLEFPNLDLSLPPPFFLQILEQEVVGVGVNYWFNPALVVRFSVEQVDGNRAAYPETREEVLEVLGGAELDRDTQVVTFGAQFSF